ncbi:putative neutral zinc metalloprotease [Sorangium cellulosum So ce56]|uniref:Neutral zinc metalloprotease n=1 Tax=Sorangium cellulosum (strain So ce56) TaxID=448385 RepID=A9GK95_SORC5|nr:putative neutral zinc metalloprotease [Sorangium cellulosum So ce56]
MARTGRWASVLGWLVSCAAGCAEPVVPLDAKPQPTADASTSASDSHTLESLEGALAPYKLVLSQVDTRFDGTVQEKYTLARDGIPVRGAGIRAIRGTDSAHVVRWLALSDDARRVSMVPGINAERAIELAESTPVIIRDVPSGAVDGAPIRADVAPAIVAPPRLRGAHPRLALEAELDDLEVTGDPTFEPPPRSIRSLRLTWRVDLLEGDARLPSDIAVIDAQTGERVRNEPAASSDQAVGLGYFSSPVPLEVQSVQIGGLPAPDGSQCLADITRTSSTPSSDPCGAIGPGIHTFIELPPYKRFPASIVRVTDTDGEFGDRTLIASTADAFGEAGRTTAADAHYSIGASYDFFRYHFGRTRLGVTDSIEVRTNSIEPTYIWNARWVHESNIIVIGQARLTNQDSRPAADPEWLGHEYGHALIDAQVGPPLENTELNALHEGISDIFGVLIDAHATRELSGGAGGFGHGTFSRVAEPVAWIWGNRIYPNDYRYFDRPSRQQYAIDAYSPAIATGIENGSIGAHYAGGIVRRAFYFAAYGVATAPNPFGPPVYNTSSYLPDGLEGIGLDPALRVLYEALVEELDPGDRLTFSSMRAAMVRAASRRYGFCSDDQKAIEDAWAAVNVGDVADRVPPATGVSVRQSTEGVVVDVTIDEARVFHPPSATLFVDGVERGTFSPELVSLGSQGARYTASLTLDAEELGDGTHAFELRADDGCENDTTSTALFAVDAAGPSGISAVDLQSSRTARRSLRISAADPHGVVSYVVDVGPLSSGTRIPANSEWRLMSDPISELVEFDFSAVPHQLTEIRVTATDGLGNHSVTSFPYLIDRAAPNQCHVTPWFRAEAPRTIVVPFTATDSLVPGYGTRIQRLVLSMDGTELWWADRAVSGEHALSVYGPNGESAEIGREVSNAADGTHTFEGRCLDSWGNEGRDTATFTMTTVPVLSTTYTTTRATLTFRLDARAESPLSTIERIRFYEGGALLADGACTPAGRVCNASYSGTLAAGASRTIEVRTWDAEGRERMAQRTITMPLCPDWSTLCGGVCRDLRSDESHCGSCSNACGSSMVCENGACVGDGPLRFTMTWDRPGDMDLHVVTPNGSEIYFANRFGQNGQLDRDDRTGTGPENVFWSTTAPRGTYLVCATPYSISASTSYTIGIHRTGASTSTRTGTRTATSGYVPCSRSSPYFVGEYVVP